MDRNIAPVPFVVRLRAPIVSENNHAEIEQLEEVQNNAK